MSLLNNKGTTLIEIIMSISILAVVICPLMTLFIVAQKINNESCIEYNSIQLAQKYMEEIKAMKSIDVASYTYNNETNVFERYIEETQNSITAEIRLKPDINNKLFDVTVTVKKDGIEINSLEGSKIFN